MSGPAEDEKDVRAGRDFLDEARVSYETHLRTCARCAEDGRTCRAAELLKRTYDNFWRAARRSRGAAFRTAPENNQSDR
ncbi:hypothetical protein [Streptomyces sp. NRRL S-340]|uniref:hypothetical protein n=1 Tax=Streptomyces sp. NRRL S-340 TaxID=1463901 RepID=UPI0005613163|nr:hypothetical protein [Streptomyces sp. NRRL S-340]